MKVFKEDVSVDEIISLLQDKDSNTVTLPLSKFANKDSSKFRMDLAKTTISEVIPEINTDSWNINSSDQEFSGFTTGTITGDPAVKLANRLEYYVDSGKIKSVVEDEGVEGRITRYEIPGFNDAQLFYFMSPDTKDYSKDRVVLAVRPIKLRRNVVLEI